MSATTAEVRYASFAEPRHPTKVAFFSNEDIPDIIYSQFVLLPIRPAVEVNGTVMEIWSSPLVPKGKIYVIDKGEE